MSFRNRQNDASILSITDKVGDPIENHIGSMIESLCTISNKRHGLRLLEIRERERAKIEYERQEKLKKQRQIEREIHNEITKCADSWNEAEKIRKFAEEISNRILGANDEEEKMALKEILEKAKAQILWLDPFAEYPDEILGKGVNIKSVIKLMGSNKNDYTC